MYNEELYHYGIKGMKWGVRRYEDASGHLTAAGKARYGDVGQAKLDYKNARRDARKAGFKVIGGTVQGTAGAVGSLAPIKGVRKASNKQLRSGMTKSMNAIKAQKNLVQAWKNLREAKRKDYVTNLSDKKTYDRMKASSTGKKIVQSMMFYDYGKIKYNQARAAGASRGKAAVDAYMNAFANNMTFGAKSMVEYHRGKKRNRG